MNQCRCSCHTTYHLCPSEMSLISFQTTTCPHEEMEFAATDMLKCHIGPLRLKGRVVSADCSPGLRQVPPSLLPFPVCAPCHSLIQLSCNNNKSEVYRLFRAEVLEGKKEQSFISFSLFHGVTLRLANPFFRKTG